MYCLETNDLTYRFSKNETVLDSVNVRLKQGAIYGFLGPNGAGKTTTLRLMLGLLKKQHGTITVFGKVFNENRLEILGKVGSLIESPSLYSHLTAEENLKILQKIYQCPITRIEEVLHLVGLAHTRNKKAGQFSLGMKQRLGIAIALLHNPALLILDEPTNGLDPNSIIEIRELLLTLNRQHGLTILISSHLLSEIEKLVTHVGIINKGKMLFQGTLEELSDRQQHLSSIMFATDNDTVALEIIQGQSIGAHIEDGRLLLPVISTQEIAEINRTLVDGGIGVFEIGIVKNDLEAIFMDLINKE